MPTSVAAKSSTPGMSRYRRSAGTASDLGSTNQPSARQAIASGTFSANVARQPPTAMSRPPRVGPITAMVCVATDSTVSTPAGRSCPVRRPSSRMSVIAAG